MSNNINKTIGFFGGSFSPPHYGHFLAACYAFKQYNLDEVWFCPSFKHALGKESWDFNFRMQLCQALILGFENQFKVSDIESSSETDGKTYNTLQLLKKVHPYYNFKLVIGSDILQQKDLWYRFEDIEKDFGLCLVPREKYSENQLAIPNFSSTAIREALDNKNLNVLEQFLPTNIIQLLQKYV
ncbi:MAG TPA: nicotinate-nicotinamide nucleotide adenylyltransferase [Oligoflexia bacterium]|nr:nicotinate-nicotinamide nucleotide adenylyltransferase [Oligoflexia bacterium]HMR24022.1 nicotinate-nicotinamide nucleotide adenylyltransferase [Oligoflexia bacterium]